jgi:hypothetical protein
MVLLLLARVLVANIRFSKHLMTWHGVLTVLALPPDLSICTHTHRRVTSVHTYVQYSVTRHVIAENCFGTKALSAGSQKGQRRQMQRESTAMVCFHGYQACFPLRASLFRISRMYISESDCVTSRHCGTCIC